LVTACIVAGGRITEERYHAVRKKLLEESPGEAD